MMDLLISRVLDHRLAQLSSIRFGHLAYMSNWLHKCFSLINILFIGDEDLCALHSGKYQALLMCEIFINKNVLSVFALHSNSFAAAAIIIIIVTRFKEKISLLWVNKFLPIF